MKLTERNINILKVISQVAGGFTVIVAVIMIFSLVQLKTMDPLDSKALAALKEQFDKNPGNDDFAAQVRAVDLMARKAYFISRRQVETGSYLLIAGAVIFVLCQRLITGNEKTLPPVPGKNLDEVIFHERFRKYLLGSSAFLAVCAVIASFMLRSSLPDLNVSGPPKKIVLHESARSDTYKPDKINYPSFRGENGRGIAGGSGYPVEWNGGSGKNIKWKTALPGKGKSSPVIWDDKIFVTSAEEINCRVICINKNNGEILWNISASGITGEPGELPKFAEESGLAVSTAAANKDVVCAIFGNGNLVCLDHRGKILWAENLGSPKNSYGYSSSLLINDNTLIIQFDSESKLSVSGLDIKTGKVIWESPRQGHPVWSSPVIGVFNGQKQVIINGNPYVSAFDPANGKAIWSVECMSNDVAPSPALNSRMVFTVTDYARMYALRPGTSVQIAWSEDNYTPDVSSPVASDSFVFLSTGAGDAACFNAETGDTLWTHYFMDPFYASPVIADEKVWFLDRTGKMHIVNESGKFSLISESALGEPTDCTPAFSDGHVFIRGKNNLYCISEN